jgi:light-regulated signal transduction histidine kinase (bacteriophytochrome)
MQMNIDEYRRGKLNTLQMMAGLMVTLLIGFIDYVTGYDLRLEIFYLMPIAFVVWFVGKKSGIFISAVSIVIIILSDILSGKIFHNYFIESWNMAMLFLFFIIVTLLLSKLQITLLERTELALELQKALHEVKMTNKDLEAFAHTVSHDLKSPLAVITGFINVIDRKYSGKLDAKMNGYVRRISESAIRMEEITDALLKLSRVTTAEMKHIAVNLSSLVKAAADDLIQSNPGRQVEFTIAQDISASGDPAMLRVMIDNLLRNAWKFTGKKDPAKIEFGNTRIDNETVYFVRDNGAGFDMTSADKLFIPFQRLHSPADFPGFGIGLTTVQRIVQRHGGRIWAEGEAAKGATFFFTL